jgi:hypothetical protein
MTVIQTLIQCLIKLEWGPIRLEQIFYFLITLDKIKILILTSKRRLRVVYSKRRFWPFFKVFVEKKWVIFGISMKFCLEISYDFYFFRITYQSSKRGQSRFFLHDRMVTWVFLRMAPDRNLAYEVVLV